MPVESTINFTCTAEGCDCIVDAINNNLQVSFTHLNLYALNGLNTASTTYADISQETAVVSISPLQALTITSSTPNTLKISGFFSGDFGDGITAYNIGTAALIGTYQGTNVLIALDSRTAGQYIYQLQGNGNLAVDVVLAIDDASSTSAIQVNSLNIFPVPATNSSVGTVTLANKTDIFNGDDGSAPMPKAVIPSAVKGAIQEQAAITASNVTSTFSANNSDFVDNYYYANSSVWHTFSNINFTKATKCKISLTYSRSTSTVIIPPVSEWEEDEFGTGPTGAAYIAFLGEIHWLSRTIRVFIYANSTRELFALEAIDSAAAAEYFSIQISSGDFYSLEGAEIKSEVVTTQQINTHELDTTNLRGFLTTLVETPYVYGSLIFGGYKIDSGSDVSISRGTILTSGTIYTNIKFLDGLQFADDDNKIVLNDVNNKWIALNAMTAGTTGYSLGLFMRVPN